MRRHVFFLTLCFYGLGLAFFLPAASGQEQTRWKVTSPYQSIPLKRAELPGAAAFGMVKGPAWLVIAYRPDGGIPTASLLVNESLIEAFPVDAFEGPEGIGGTRSLVQVALQDDGPSKSVHVGGAFLDSDIFEWLFAPPKEELERWLAAAGKEIKIYVLDPADESRRLEAVFSLPEDTQPLRDMLGGYLK